uniref:ATP-dependent RNA helicase n=1 Tax=Phallusia mammillata TaxID=59560 RepID=A0A6F9DAM0_9ASCI|nr:ATP-dependent RNA helicase DDX51-like [Phallusia mammillata]
MMSLFTIQRYTGDDNETDENQLKRQASKALKQIRRRAKRLKLDAAKEHEEFEEVKPEKNVESEEQQNPDPEGKESIPVTVLSEEDRIPEGIILDDEERTETSSRIHLKKGIHQVGSFTVLGEQETERVQKVSRKLPDWLMHPQIIEDISASSHQETAENFPGLNSTLIQNLKEKGINSLFPVQQAVIPVILRDTKHGCGPCIYPPSDICVSAPTGSGKTLAFAVPIVQSLMNRVNPVTRALVVLPTKELAAQIFDNFLSLCRNTSLRCALLAGTKGNIFHEQKALIKQGTNGKITSADIVVATPGRLSDHLNQTEHFTLEHLRFLVIDEADRMMDQIKQQWLPLVEESVYKNGKRQKTGVVNLRSLKSPTFPLQKLLFSATLSADPEKLEQLNLFQPRLFTARTKTALVGKKSQPDMEKSFVGKYTTPSSLKEHMIICSAGEKPLIVIHLAVNANRILCFAGSKETARRLTALLQLYAKAAAESKSFTCAEFSSNLTSVNRNKVLKNFKAGKINILICSDSMARGMDIHGVSNVILYDSPPLIKTYIHRIGRTARAGEPGTAYTLLRRGEVFHFKKMLKEAGKTKIKELEILQKDLDNLTPIYEKVLPHVAEKLKENKR